MLKVIHIIPSAFSYFDDIKSRGFAIMEALGELGVENNAITLQYSAPSKAGREGIKSKAPSQDFKGMQDISSAISSLAEYDVVHLHCPFFGVAGKIINWKKSHSQIPLVITYYRRVPIVDFFSVFIKLYAIYYLPKIFSLADIIVCKSVKDFRGAGGNDKDEDKVLELDDIIGDKNGSLLAVNEAVEKELAFKYLMIYNKLVIK